jgi:hypothetical protein
VLKQLVARKSVATINREIETGPRLNRVLGARTLTAIGLGSMIGSGIFVLTGTVAANHTGPAITLAFLVAAIGCGLAAICYAELAALIPVSGSAYSYTYATLGEGVAWFVGWNLALEYMMSAATVAVGWSGYVVNLFEDFGVHLPAALTSAPVAKAADHSLQATGAIVNLPAVLIVAALTWICYRGIRESASMNNIMVIIKVAIIVLFIVAGLSYVDTANWHPYLPENTGESGHFGASGIMMGAAIIYFAYIGFDTAATTAQEARNPQRDVPAGILGALVISTVLYVAMAAVMTGMVSYTKLDVAAPVAVALDEHPSLFFRPAGEDRRDRRHDLGDPDVDPRAAAYLHGDVPRRPAAGATAEGAPAPSHAARRNARDRPDCRGLRRGVPDRHPGRAGLDRHPARVHRGLRGRADPALYDAGSRPPVPRPVRPAGVHRRRADVPRPHAVPAARYLGTARDLDRHRFRHLFRIRVLEQPAAEERGALVTAAVRFTSSARPGSAPSRSSSARTPRRPAPSGRPRSGSARRRAR